MRAFTSFAARCTAPPLVAVLFAVIALQYLSLKEAQATEFSCASGETSSLRVAPLHRRANLTAIGLLDAHGGHGVTWLKVSGPVVAQRNWTFVANRPDQLSLVCSYGDDGTAIIRPLKVGTTTCTEHFTNNSGAPVPVDVVCNDTVP